jgi:hypothetical protein
MVLRRPETHTSTLSNLFLSLFLSSFPHLSLAPSQAMAGSTERF